MQLFLALLSAAPSCFQVVTSRGPQENEDLEFPEFCISRRVARELTRRLLYSRLGMRPLILLKDIPPVDPTASLPLRCVHFLRCAATIRSQGAAHVKACCRYWEDAGDGTRRDVLCLRDHLLPWLQSSGEKPYWGQTAGVVNHRPAYSIG